MMFGSSDMLAAELRLRSLIDNVLDVILVVDHLGVIGFQSPSTQQVLGYAHESLVGRKLASYIHPDDNRAIAQVLQHPASGPEKIQKAELRFLHGNGAWHILECAAKSFIEEGLPRIVINARDITDRRLAEKQLRESRERYELAVAATNDGLWDWSLERGEVYYSTRWKRMLGLRDDEVGNSEDDWFRLIHPAEMEAVRSDFYRHIEGHTPQFRSEHRVRHADGTYRYMVSRGLAVRDSGGKALRIVVAQSDITDQKITQEQLLHDALHDKLTGLPNRALLIDRLEHAIGCVSRRPGYEFAVLFLDLDRFKIVNDSLGHTIGDGLLVEVTRRLKRIVRSNDTFARLGGDEFTILMDDIAGVEDATRLADRVQEELSVPFVLEGHEVFPTVSIGIALSKTGYQRAAEVLRDADIAMYRAKASGKACYEVFDRTMHQKAMTLLWMEADIRRALDRNEWELHYQPIVSLRNGSLAGFEALARWHHPERGMIPPSEFIPIAEETGLIVLLGEWVLREACRQMGEWNGRLRQLGAEPLVVAVNISSKQFSQPGLVDKVRGTLESLEFEARYLKLEITESVIMENALSAAEMLRQLQELNVQLSIDDFGTGYSSLSSLQQFPLHTLKIDRSFVERLDTESGSSAIIRTIVSLANNLGMDVVAEGIETESQLAKLMTLGCDYGQGYFFSRPLKMQDVDSLLEDGAAGWPLPPVTQANAAIHA